MRHIWKLAICAVIGTALLMSGTFAADAHYVGAKKCKVCHNKKSETQQYDIWEASSHAKAYESLASDLAKEYATKAGIEGDPQQAAECLECHVTAFGVDTALIDDSFVPEEGVQCEACHGPGSGYKSSKIMSSKKYADQRETQHKLALEAGLVIPDEKTCVKCHNERSPAFEGFDYKEYYAKIKHEYAE